MTVLQVITLLFSKVFTSSISSPTSQEGCLKNTLLCRIFLVKKLHSCLSFPSHWCPQVCRAGWKQGWKACESLQCNLCVCLWVLRLMSWTFKCYNSKGRQSTLKNPSPHLLFQVHTICEQSKYFAKFYIRCQSSSLFFLLKITVMAGSSPCVLAVWIASFPVFPGRLSYTSLSKEM